jgi:phosphoglycolate phosphatase-like HAD superfamily hydrolase
MKMSKNQTNPPFILKDGTVFIDPDQIKLIIFDKDGTLADLNMWFEIMKKRARALGAHFGLSSRQINQIIITMGLDPLNNEILDIGILTKSRFDTEKAVADKLVEFGIDEKTALETIHNIFGEVDRTTDLVAIAKPLGDLKKLFQEIYYSGIKIAVATSDLAERGCRIMEAFGVLDYISVIAGADSIKNDKPAPDMILKICKSLGIPPSKTAMVGDNVWDHQMAKNAGCMLSIGVLTGKDDYEAMSKFADCVIESVNNIKIKKRSQQNFKPA